MNNTIGNLFSLTTFGESHGPALGGVIDGCPPGIPLDLEEIEREMARRRPGQSNLTTPRNEADKVRFLSGLSVDNVTTGTPIGFIIENTTQRSSDYAEISQAFRPGHADYTYHVKYKGFNDIRGGGRSSARETACRVVAGAVARQILRHMVPSMTITAYTHAVGPVCLDKDYDSLDLNNIEANAVRCPDSATARRMEDVILAAKADGDTVGGVVRCVIEHSPVGLGQPVFNKLNAALASAMMSINAAKGFEIGRGFELAKKRGSECIDTWTNCDEDNRGVRTLANNSGGIQGGLSNGEDIVFSVAFKPVATLLRDVETVDTNLRPTTLRAKGRHDPCVVPRAVPVVEAMAAITILDALLYHRAYNL